MALRDNLKRLREAQGITGKDFAAKIGINYATYMTYENPDESKARWPSEDTLMKIAAALQVPIDELLGNPHSEITKNISLCRKMGLQINSDKENGSIVNVAIFKNERCMAQVSPATFNMICQYTTESALKSAAQYFNLLLPVIAKELQYVEILCRQKGYDFDPNTYYDMFDQVRTMRENGGLDTLAPDEYLKKIQDIVEKTINMRK